MNINEIEKAKWRILNELIKDEYSFSFETFKIFLRKIQNVEVILSSVADSEILILLNDVNEKYKIEYKMPNQKNSFILDYPPILIENNFYFLKPVINLNGSRSDSEVIYTFYHELCHLLSTSDWIYDSDNKCMMRRSGIMEEVYEYGNGEVKRKDDKENRELVYLNEFLNEYVAYYFWQKIEQKSENMNCLANNNRMKKLLEEFIKVKFDNNVIDFIKAYIFNELFYEELGNYFGKSKDK